MAWLEGNVAVGFSTQSKISLLKLLWHKLPTSEWMTRFNHSPLSATCSLIPLDMYLAEL